MFIPAIRAIGSPQNICPQNEETGNYKRTTLQFQASALTLFVTRILADDANNAIAADDLAIAADAFDRSHYFHDATPNDM
jgi:hypothetical protein